jgi:hypothetical protein
LLPIFEKEGWSHAQIADDWGMSLATLEGHLTQETGMPATSKHDYPALFEEYDQRLARGEPPKEIRAAFESRGVNWGTYQNRRSQWNKAHRSTPEERQNTTEAHPSTPKEPELWTVHPGTPERSDLTETVVKSYAEHLSTPESTEILSDEQYTQEHPDTPVDSDPTEVHHGTLEAHQEVMEDISQSVPDAPHIGTEETFQSMPEHPSTPEVHQELSPSHSSVVHSGVPARQEHLISTPEVHPGTPSEKDWELWGVVKTRWTEVEKMLADWKTRQALLSTPRSTPRNTIKKTYVVDSAHVAWIDQYAREHGLDIKDVLFMAIEAFIRARSGQEV